jgi:hypothetical protein
MEDNNNVDPYLRDSIRALNSTVSETTHGPEMDAFISTYNLLPEVNLSSLMGAPFTVEYTNSSLGGRFNPLAMHAGRLLVREQTEEGKREMHPKYSLLRGFVLSTPKLEHAHGDTNARKLLMRYFLEGENGKIGKLYDSDNREFPAMAESSVLCRDAYGVWSDVMGLEELGSARARQRSFKTGVLGELITVARGGRRPSAYFVEAQISLRDPIKNIRTRLGSEVVKYLSFVGPTSTD